MKEKPSVFGDSVFKPNTDDIRFAASLDIIDTLLKEGFTIKVYDQEGMENIQKKYTGKLTYCSNPYDVVKGVDALAILTEWNEFKQIDLVKVKKSMKTPPHI